MEELLAEVKQHSRVIEGCEGKIKHASRNAVAHITQAVYLLKHDPLMAMFRAICAEEEAATALICSVKQQGYPKSEYLKEMDHSHKHCVIVLIQVVREWYLQSSQLDGFPFRNPKFRFADVQGRDGIELGFELVIDPPSYVVPQPPLGLKEAGGDLSEKLAAELGKLFQGKKFETIWRRIRDSGSFRNKLLYAGPTGRPGIPLKAPLFVEQKIHAVGAILMVLGLIDPWREPNYYKSDLVSAVIQVMVRLIETSNRNSRQRESGKG